MGNDEREHSLPLLEYFVCDTLGSLRKVFDPIAINFSVIHIINKTNQNTSLKQNKQIKRLSLLISYSPQT